MKTAPMDAARPNAPLWVRPHHPDDLCVVAPHPDVKEKLIEQFDRLRSRAADLVGRNLSLKSPQSVGLNDGLIYPGTYYPTGTTAAVAQRAALERAPLRGTVRVIVVLVDFSDKAMGAEAVSRFEELFFSTGALQHGSVREYFHDVSGGLINIDGQVVGPFRMPQTVANYAGVDNGMQPAFPNARTMANDAVTAANPHVDFAPYDNDGNGYVDAFIVVHAGRGAEETGAAADIWSHKWVLPSERSVDGSKIFAYLTIPEDAKLGVCAHELGHLVFGWPDLYDTDNTSEGIGNWCLMASGSWGLSGDRPTQPSAWCKTTQGWINVVTQTTNATVTIKDIKSSRTAYRLWKDGAGGNEYFLVENRQQDGYDASMPGEGLLIWHVDEAIAGNTNEVHYKVALMQADGSRHLENNANRGDAGDSYPGSSGNSSFTDTSTPNSKSYAGSNTCVSVTSISPTGSTMTAHLGVRCSLKPPKDVKEIKEIKEVKERPKESKEIKDVKEIKEVKERPKERPKEFKEVKELKERPKEFKEFKERPKEFKERPKELKDVFEIKPTDGLPAGGGGFGGAVGFGHGGGDPMTAAAGDIAERLAALETTVAALVDALSGGTSVGVEAGDPFIGAAERPQLGYDVGGPDLGDLRAAMEAGSAEAKATYDSLPPQ
jgi:M6 family metalloprotease-like protein